VISFFAGGRGNSTSPQGTGLKEKDHFTVHNDSHSEYKTKWLAKAGEEIHFKSGDKIVFEAGSDMTIKGGDSFIRLTPAGIVILGSQVKINEGGSPGSGSGASPELPDEATKPGEATKPKRTKVELKDGKDKEEVNAGESGEEENGDPEGDAMESTAA
jgi:type VI secretion system secreted protein VgrG